MIKILKKILLRLVPKIQETKYDYIYSSRKVIKNKYINKDADKHFYKLDVWGKANDILKPFLEKGMSVYYEIVGYVNNTGKLIQKKYDYGCEVGKFEVYIYRITSTNNDGKVFEYSMYQLQDWCKMNGLKAVPLLYYGYAMDVFDWKEKVYSSDFMKDDFPTNFLSSLKEEYLEGDCSMCKNKVPDEGIVVRIEKNDIQAFKLKSERFYLHETKLLDSGEVDIES